MICPECHGTGIKREWLSLMGGCLWRDIPCPECIGGIASCCDAAGSAEACPNPPDFDTVWR